MLCALCSLKPPPQNQRASYALCLISQNTDAEEVWNDVCVWSSQNAVANVTNFCPKCMQVTWLLRFDPTIVPSKHDTQAALIDHFRLRALNTA